MGTVAVTAASEIRAIDIGAELTTSTVNKGNAFEDNASVAVVAGSLVVFAPGVSDLHQRDVLQSLLLSQLAANGKAERHKDPVNWFKAYRSVLEQTAWVVEANSTITRYLPRVSKFSVATVVNDVFRQKVLPDELTYITAAINAYRSDLNGASQLVFECPSHSGGIGNFQVALVSEENNIVSVRIAQVSFNAPQHVIRLMLEEFTNNAQFQVGFIALIQNAEIYATVRNVIADKVKTRFEGSVTFLQLS